LVLACDVVRWRLRSQNILALVVRLKNDMYPHLVYAFMDGGYLRESAHDFGQCLVDPRKLAVRIVETVEVQTWAANPGTTFNSVLARVTYYDALPDETDPNETPDAKAAKAAELKDYWRAVELLPDTHLGFGKLVGTGQRLRQKAVDTLLATDMLVGAFSGLFDIALLVTGDADFVPVVEEVKRRGVMVVVAVAKTGQSVSDDLIRVADRYVDLTANQWHEMKADERTWKPDRDREI